MLSHGEATLRSTFYFLNTDDFRGKRAVQAHAAAAVAAEQGSGES